MGKQYLSLIYKFFLVWSVSLNFLLFSLVISRNSELSWSKKAAAEAEAAASVSCSGHGRAYIDGFVLDGGKPVCECNGCYAGHDCSEVIPDCIADADSGNPTFLEPFWRKNAASSAIMVAGWHRMGYEFEDGSLTSKELEKQIRKLHATAGNAITDGKYIVFGGGSTQLLSAAVNALSSKVSSSPTKVVASVPYYPVYKSQTELFKSMNFNFSGDTMSWKRSSNSSMNFIEFVTSPNNPDGQLKTAILRGPNAKQIHDLAYYWPHYTSIPSPIDEDLMIFTLSKLTGHAGSRLGWAIIKDKNVYDRMVNYIDLNTYGIARETQLRALKLLNVALQGDGRNFFDFGHETMKLRWQKLRKILSASSKRFSIQELKPHYCTFSSEIRSPAPAFAWIKCNEEEEKDCHAVLRAAKILGRRGRVFGASSSYVRLSLVNSQDEFNQLMHKLEMLVFEEATNSVVEFTLGDSEMRNRYYVPRNGTSASGKDSCGSIEMAQINSQTCAAQ
ncbi:unnamed protein product [Coffea canephora]|uniref:Alliinase C-terminal domain-containing protein n=1 Tax=Coffea canephora TaxID=49390 RepID=A0A068USC9_COFCA|nr:unnamed protein product [Coffea canephora]